MSTARLDQLKAIEAAVQAKWETEKVFQVNAPAAGEAKPPKFFVTFPYPYMNGKLHIGHGFSLSKAEFAARYWRMKGHRSLWPFGLHVTGTPIAACAKKIANEMAKYGNPPQFPTEEEEEAPKPAADVAPTGPMKYKSKRGKVGPAMPQWQVMKNMGIADEEIPAFADANHWLKYFPSLAIDDLKATGVHVDWRRSFITTDVNPFYDSFIKWQFEQLRAGGYLGFGKRYSIYSPTDGQPCADHDRASGEGVQPQEYTLVKLKVKGAKDHPVFAPFASIIGDMDVVLPGATLRTETVIGQTNCWVSSEFAYKAYAVTTPSGKKEVFIMTARAARNLCYQGIPVNDVLNGEPEPLFEIEGSQMVGLPLSAPYCKYDTIYTLPMASISETKGTGIVMSVPSDSCDDYVNFTTLLAKPAYREKLGIKDEWVTPFEVIPIIEIPGELGRDAAKVTVEKLGITSAKDTAKLEEAKKIVYQAGFYQGVMIAGPFAGCKVAEAKVKMMKEMTDNEIGLRYFEPTKEVISRSGDECVVALCDQWFIEYGKEDWKKSVTEHVEQMDMYFPGIRNGFEETLNWLSDWPCSRTFGLGTTLPCDASNSMIIDSLSDSTIYMAYYTVAHFFHGTANGNSCLDASSPNQYGIKPDMMTSLVWNYIMHGTGSAEECNKATGISAEVVEKMRTEFSYWYPVDLRVSAKDLIQNHLTMFLYNHAAIWPANKELWPKSIYCNGHIQVNNEKMSKSKGNFIMLRQAVNTYGADCTRIACADAGDSMDDANFVSKTAEDFIMRLTTLVDQCKELTTKVAEFRTGEFTIFDKIFANTVNAIVDATSSHYAKMSFRMALGSAYHELTKEFNQYKLACESNSMHADLVRRYTTTITLLMQPLAPHVSEHIWTEVLGEKGSVVNAPFPTADPIDYSMHVASRVIADVCKEIRIQAQKNAKKRNVDEICVYVATTFLPWQMSALDTLNRIYAANGNSFPADTTKQVQAAKEPWLTKEVMPDAMAFMAFIRQNAEKYGADAIGSTPSIDDAELLGSIAEYVAKTSGVQKVHVLTREDETYPEHKAAKSKVRPGEPSVAFPPVKK